MNAESDHPERHPVTIKVHPEAKEPYVLVTIDVGPANSRQALATELIGAVELQCTETPKGAARLFNCLIHGTSPNKRGLAKRNTE